MFNYLRMKEFIDNRGIKQKYIAKRAGINESTLCMILTGKRKCTVDEYAKICRCIGCDFSYCLDDREVS